MLRLLLGTHGGRAWRLLLLRRGQEARRGAAAGGEHACEPLHKGIGAFGAISQ